MTLRDFIKRLSLMEDLDKMIIFRDRNGGWSNVDLPKITDTSIELTIDYSRPFSSDN